MNMVYVVQTGYIHDCMSSTSAAFGSKVEAERFRKELEEARDKDQGKTDVYYHEASGLNFVVADYTLITSVPLLDQMGS